MKLKRLVAYILIVDTNGGGVILYNYLSKNSSQHIYFSSDGKVIKFCYYSENPHVILTINASRWCLIWKNRFVYCIMCYCCGILTYTIISFSKSKHRSVTFFSAKATDETLSIALGLKRSYRTQRSDLPGTSSRS